MISSLLLLATPALADCALWSGKHIEKGTLTCYRQAGETGADSVTVEVESDVGGESVEAELVATTTYFNYHGKGSITEMAGSSGGITLYDGKGKVVASHAVRVDDAGTITVDGGAGVAFDTLEGEHHLVLALDEVDAGVASAALSLKPPRKIDWTYSDGGIEMMDEWETRYSTSHAGDVTWSAVTYDAEGKKEEKVDGTTAAALDDGAEGVPAVAMEDDASLTTALVRLRRGHYGGVIDRDGNVWASHGWTVGDAPEALEVEVDGGETWEIPANSYQVATSFGILFGGGGKCDAGDDAYLVSFDGTPAKSALAFGDRGVCQYGHCAFLEEADDGSWTLGVTAYAATAKDLPGKVTVSLESQYGCAKPTQSAYAVAFDDDVTVVFAQDLGFDGSPAGATFSGGATALVSDHKGRYKHHGSRAKWHARVDVGPTGNVAWTASGKVSSSGEGGGLLLGGEAIAVETVKDLDGDGVVAPPPVIVYKNGKGTRDATTASNGSPGLL